MSSIQSDDGGKIVDNITDSTKNSNVPVITNIIITNRYGCTVCSFKCSSLNLLKTHIKGHRKKRSPEDGPINVKCTDCCFIYSYPFQLETHMKSEHMEKLAEDDSSTTYVLPDDVHKVCFLGDPVPPKLISPENPKKKKVTVHSCRLCDFTTENKKKFTEHKHTHLKAIGEQIFKCSRCSYTSTRKDLVHLHSGIHYRTGTYEQRPTMKRGPAGQSCGSPAKSSKVQISNTSMPVTSAPDTHLEDPSELSDEFDDDDIDHGATLFKCSECNFTDSVLDKVRQHTEVAHVSEKIFRCSECGFKAIDLDTIINHKCYGFEQAEPEKTNQVFQCKKCLFLTPLHDNFLQHKCEDILTQNTLQFEGRSYTSL